MLFRIVVVAIEEPLRLSFTLLYLVLAVLVKNSIRLTIFVLN